MFGFLKKKPKRMSSEEAGKVIDLLLESSVKIVRGVKAPEGWDARARLFLQAEYGCFLVFIVSNWHRMRPDQVGENPLLLDLYRSEIENGVTGIQIAVGLTGKPEALTENRCRIYQSVMLNAGLAFTEHWSDVFAHLAFLAHKQRKVLLHDCESRGDVYDLLLKEGIFPDALDILYLKSEFSAILEHQLPVQLDMITALHEARTGKIIT
ncbi:MAG: hypothetical protein ACOYM3_05540 [Terrimicrobiaceae bacterium]